MGPPAPRVDALRDRGALIDGEMPGTIVVDRNVLEWRRGLTRPDRIVEMSVPDRPVVIVCHEGTASSLAATGLHQLGMRLVIEHVGGFQARQRTLP